MEAALSGRRVDPYAGPSPDDPVTSARLFRRAKIVCTVGPACRDPETFRALIEAGSDAIRINFSHADHAEAAGIIEATHAVGREMGRPVAVIADLQGPKIRVGELPSPLHVVEGERCLFVPEGEEREGEPEGGVSGRVIPTTYAGLADDVAAGDRILLDDGRIEVRVVEVEGRCVETEVVTPGELSSHKGINLPGVRVGAPSLTAKDREDLAFALDRGVDYVALSFVRRPEDVAELREIVGGRSLVIAKIEKDQALQDLDEIIRLSDGVMVARGDLGVELPYEEVPLVQKRVIMRGQEFARPSITATQMLESMITNTRPTRAEVSDVATALLDGSDAVMLSAETAVGAHPIEAVRVMERIARRIEREGPPFPSGIREHPGTERAAVQQTTSGAVAAAAMQAVQRLGAPFLVTFTRSGFTARVVSAQRSPVPILAVTDQTSTYRQLALVWGVHPVLFDGEVNYRNMLDRARSEALQGGFGRPGDRFIVTAGVPFHVTGTTNMMRIEEL
jgi:pyruvate kinase